MNIDTVVPGEVDATGEVEKKALDVDDARLLAMGKRPELRRVYNTWTCEFQFSNTCSALLIGSLSVCVSGHANG